MEEVKIELLFLKCVCNKPWHLQAAKFNKNEWPKELDIETVEKSLVGLLLDHTLEINQNITCAILDYQFSFRCLLIKLHLLNISELTINPLNYKFSFRIHVNEINKLKLLSTNIAIKSNSKTFSILYNNITNILSTIQSFTNTSDYIGPKTFLVIGNEGSGKSFLLNGLLDWCKFNEVNSINLTLNNFITNDNKYESLQLNHFEKDNLLFRLLERYNINTSYNEKELLKLTIIFLDDMNITNVSNNLIELQSFINDIKNKNCNYIIIGFSKLKTNILNFEKVLNIIKPDYIDRYMILSTYLTINCISIINLPGNMDMSSNYVNRSFSYDINECSLRLADLTNGYLPNDLINIIKKSIIIEIGTLRNESIKNLINWNNILISYNLIIPKQMIEIDNILGINNSPNLTKEKLTWEDFCGYPNVKKKISSILLRYNIENHNMNNNQGIVLYGPSGCGKSYLAAVIASEIKMNFISIRSTNILSKYFGETENKLRQIFRHARDVTPCVLFFDEFDSISCKRSMQSDDSNNDLNTRILSTFLNELDGITTLSTSNMLVIVACENIDILDDALLRPGRLQYHILLDYPSFDDIVDIFNKKFMNNRTVKCSSDVNINDITNSIMALTSFPTCSLIEKICKSTRMIAMREYITRHNNIDEEKNENYYISTKHFIQSINQTFNL